MADSPTQRVVITGGKGGLGNALAAAFRNSAAEVHAPGRAELDMQDERQIRAYFESLPSLDVLILNAGITRDGPLLKMANADWDDVMTTNLRGPFLCARMALAHFTPARRGHLIFIGSRAARNGTAGQANYVAAKAGLIALAQSIAREGGPANVQSNVVLPGFLETAMTAHLGEKHRIAHRADQALGRFNTPENAARFIVFLAGLEHVSGQVFNLDSRFDPWT